VTVENLSSAFDRRLAVTYRAASPGQTLTLRYIQETSGGNITLQAATLEGGPPSGLVLPIMDDFSDGNLDGWSIVDENDDPVFDTPSDWFVANGRLRQGARVESTRSFDGTYHLGSYAYLTGFTYLSDYRFSVEAEYLSAGFAEDIGVLFRWQNPDNYYRLSINSRYGFTRLEKRIDGNFVPLATNSRGYNSRGDLASEVLAFEIEIVGPEIRVWRNGDPLFAYIDLNQPHLSGTVALYTQDQAAFDNVYIDAPSISPTIVISKPLAHLTTSGLELQAEAQVANAPTGAYVEFLLDEANPVVDDAEPYAYTFPIASPDNHSVTAVLRNGSGDELARDTNVVVGVGGEFLVAIGDSITNGIWDRFRSDNQSSLGRVIAFQGYAANLTDLLDQVATAPANIVFNEGIGGDTAFDAASKRVDSLLARHPDMDTALIMLGTNDSGMPVPPSTFKEDLQGLVDILVDAGATVVIAAPPPTWSAADPWNSTRNALIREYILAIEDIVSATDGAELGPNFFDFFMPADGVYYRDLFDDTLHPNGLGHYLMAYKWAQNLYPGAGIVLPFFLHNLTSAGRPPQQNLLEVGDGYYVADGGSVDKSYVLEAIPAELAGGRWIMTANADVGNTDATYLTFDAQGPFDLYVAYDAGAASIPNWFADEGFQLVNGIVVETSNTEAPRLNLYRKAYNLPGPITVTLPGTDYLNATGANANYVGIAVER